MKSIASFINETKQINDTGVEDIILDFVSWNRLSKSNILKTVSDDFFIKYKNYLLWHYICNEITLSENVIRNCEDVIDWHGIAGKQIMSEEFIKEFKYKFRTSLEWEWILKHNKDHLSDAFIKEIENTLMNK